MKLLDLLKHENNYKCLSCCWVWRQTCPSKEDASIDKSGSELMFWAQVLARQLSEQLAWPGQILQGPAEGPSVWFPSTLLHTQSATASLASSLFLELSQNITAAAAAAKSLQSCPTLCYPRDGSPSGSPVPGILQARTLEWVAISFSNAWKWKVKVKSLSHVQLLSTPWTAARQAPPSMGFYMVIQTCTWLTPLFPDVPSWGTLSKIAHTHTSCGFPLPDPNIS